MSAVTWSVRFAWPVLRRLLPIRVLWRLGQWVWEHEDYPDPRP